MSKTLYVYSTLAADVDYQLTRPGANDIPEVVGSVLVKGGAGVVPRKGEPDGAPNGIATPISEAQRDLLEANGVFQVHMQNGYVQITSDNPDPERVAVGMNVDQKSRQLGDADFEATAGAAKVETGKSKK